VIEFFAEILQKLGEELGTPLNVDKNGACLLVYKRILKVQIQNYPEKEELLLGAFLGEIVPGKFRENVFKEALKTNSLFPNQGAFSYVKRSNELILSHLVPYEGLTSSHLSKILLELIEKANLWYSSIQSGSLHLVAQDVRPERSDRPMFGIR